MLPWQPFLAFYIWGAHWRHLKNMTEPSMCGSDAALCQITLTTYYYYQSTGCRSHIMSVSNIFFDVEMPGRRTVLWDGILDGIMQHHASNNPCDKCKVMSGFGGKNDLKKRFTHQNVGTEEPQFPPFRFVTA